MEVFINKAKIVIDNNCVLEIQKILQDDSVAEIKVENNKIVIVCKTEKRKIQYSKGLADS